MRFEEGPEAAIGLTNGAIKSKTTATAKNAAAAERLLIFSRLTRGFFWSFFFADMCFWSPQSGTGGGPSSPFRAMMAGRPFAACGYRLVALSPIRRGVSADRCRFERNRVRAGVG